MSEHVLQAVAPAEIQALEQDFIEELARIQAVRELMRCSMQGRPHFPAKSYMSVSAEAEQDLAEATMTATVAAAEQFLSRPGMPVRCDTATWKREQFEVHTQAIPRGWDYSQRTARVREIYSAFRPTRLWAHIAGAYTPERLLQEARGRAADALVQALSLSRQDEIRRVAGRIEIEIRMYSEPTYSNPKVREYSWNWVSQFRGIEQAAEVMAVASGMDTTRYGWLELASSLEGRATARNRFCSRDREDFPGGLSYVCFQNAIKVYLPEAVAMALNLFVSQYAPERMHLAAT